MDMKTPILLVLLALLVACCSIEDKVDASNELLSIQNELMIEQNDLIADQVALKFFAVERKKQLELEAKAK